MPGSTRKKLVILDSHPIQYFGPLYKEIERSGYFDLEVWFCSPHGLKGELDRQFGTSVRWDIPILEGFPHRFLRNCSPRPTIYSFWGLMNFEVITALWSLPRGSIVVVHSWAYLTHWLTVFFAAISGHTVCLRTETPAAHEEGRSGFKYRLRTFFIKNLLFTFADRFLYVGNENKRFYLMMGVPEKKLIFTPYSVDNARFQEEARKFAGWKKSLRSALQLPEDAFIVLYCGKYIEKKRPLDLLKAIAAIPRKDVVAVFVGDGELRKEMEKFIHQKHLEQRAFLTGFVNQSRIAQYYALADLFIMCSDVGETWGLATNEAMNFSLPVIISDRTGCAYDLVENGHNGFLVGSGNIEELAEKISYLADIPEAQRRKMGIASVEIVNQYSYQNIIQGLRCL